MLCIQFRNDQSVINFHFTKQNQRLSHLFDNYYREFDLYTNISVCLKFGNVYSD